MSRTLDAMAEAGLVERRARENDGRVRECALTKAGQAAFREVWPLMCSVEERMFGGIPDEEREAFLSTLQRILNNIRRHDF